PGHYVILCADAIVSQFKNYGPVVGCSNFPTLNNSGDALTLRNPASITIDSVHYRSDWYRDGDKAEGGWSLERIDPANFCAGSENWMASEDPAGGTPGRQNAVIASMPDNMGPRLVRAIPI